MKRDPIKLLKFEKRDSSQMYLNFAMTISLKNINIIFKITLFLSILFPRKENSLELFNLV